MATLTTTKYCDVCEHLTQGTDAQCNCTDDQAVAYFSEQVTITMSRSEWQSIAIQLRLRETDRRVRQETRDWLRWMRNRIWTTIHG